MSKWKLQAVEPDTCDSPGCRYIEMYDVLATPPRPIVIVAFDRVCPAHITTVPIGVMLWEDGNWKPKEDYINYQRKWFMRQNYLAWQIDHPDEAMPRTIRNSNDDPITTGSVSAPPQVEIDNMNQAYNQNREHNVWKNQAVQAITDEGVEREGITWAFTGAGDARILTITAPTLSIAQRNDARSKVDIQFGPGKVIIER